MTTNDESKLDNMTVRRFAKLLKNSSGGSNTSTPITTGKVVKNDNDLVVAVDDETLVPIADSNSNVKVGDTVTIGLTNENALILGNITNKGVTSKTLKETENGLKLEISNKASKTELSLEADKLSNKITNTQQELSSEITQTAEGLEVKIDEVKTSADEAKKVATNYLRFSSDEGLVVGNMSDSTLKGNTQITNEGMNIRNGTTNYACFNPKDSFIGYQNGDSEKPFGDSASLSFMTNQNGDSALKFLTYPGIDWEKGEYISKIISNYCIILESDSGKIRIGTTAGSIVGEVAPEVTISSKISSASILVGTALGSKSGIEFSAEKLYKSDTVLGEIYGETVLYSDATGTTSAITLSQSASKFTYLEIYFNYAGTNTAYRPASSTKVFSPNGKFVTLQLMYRANSTTMQVLQENIGISGTKISRTAGWYLNGAIKTGTVGAGSNTGSAINITRVVGLK